MSQPPNCLRAWNRTRNGNFKGLLVTLDLEGKRALVVGCGFGEDALRLAKLGADVYAFDLSPDSVSIASALAEREGLNIVFAVMPAETMTYDNDFFDVVIARDILHHVDIPRTIKEISRVSKCDALFLVNEIYSHSFTDKTGYPGNSQTAKRDCVHKIL